jgi:hypothetical protein
VSVDFIFALLALPPTRGTEIFRIYPFGSDGIFKESLQEENQWKDHPFVRKGWGSLVRKSLTKPALSSVFNDYFLLAIHQPSD